MATVHESTTGNGGIVTAGYYYREEVNNNKKNTGRPQHLSSSAYELSSMDEYIIDVDDDDEQDHLTDDEDNEYYDSEYDNDDGRVYSRVAGAETEHTSSSTVNGADCPPFPSLQAPPTSTAVHTDDEPTFTRRPLIVRNGSARTPQFHTTDESSEQLG